jgi:hypothetical protein
VKGTLRTSASKVNPFAADGVDERGASLSPARVVRVAIHGRHATSARSALNIFKYISRYIAVDNRCLRCCRYYRRTTKCAGTQKLRFGNNKVCGNREIRCAAHNFQGAIDSRRTIAHKNWKTLLDDKEFSESIQKLANHSSAVEVLMLARNSYTESGLLQQV